MIFNWPDKAKTDYVLSHFKMSYHLPMEVEDQFVFNDELNGSGSINFKLSTADISDHIIHIEDIPVLFPLGNEKELYIISDDSLIFQHDILKSAFYLLSGFQEYLSEKKDHFNRFPYNFSVQKRLGIVTKPVVNYYFQWIADALNVYAEKNSLPNIKKKILFNRSKFGFFLTHDIDRVDYYTFNEMVYRAKQLFGLTASKQKMSESIRLLWDAKWNYFFTRNNPAWDFKHLMGVEKKYDISATYFFLDKDLKHQDAYYDIDTPRIKKLIRWLKEQGAEIGIHGVCRSSTDERILDKQHHRLTKVLGKSPLGIRQHRLMYRNPETTRIHQNSPLKFDSTLAFAEHEGFRNSYCHPFRIFDHENNCPADTWEFPLNVMDVTLFFYQDYSLPQASKAVQNVVEEVRKFNGLFTMLWHNGFNDERKIPGIKKFYEELVGEVIERGGEGVSAKDLIKRLQEDVR